MSKVRVHELAKEYGLDNGEVLAKLQAAGISVKTHSSSVYEEEARAALEKGKGKPAEAKKPIARPGMMIVRRKTAEELAADAPAGGAHEEESAAAAPGHAEARTAADSAPDEVQEPIAAPQDDGEEVQTSEAAPDVQAEESAEVAPDAPAGEPQVEAQAPVGAAQPGDRPGAARVLRMIDRDKLLERVPSNRLGGRGGPGGPRPGGPSGPGGPRTGGQRFGQVTELRVVNDPFGRGREMVTVGRDKKGAKKGPAAAEAGKKRGPTKREMIEMRERAVHPARLKRKKVLNKPTGERAQTAERKASKRVIRMKDTIVIADLAHELQVKAFELLHRVADLGVEVQDIADSIDLATAQLVAQEFEYKVESTAFSEEEALGGTPVVTGEAEAEVDTTGWEPRPPVVTIMGHVDHGKTSLLDAIRKAKVAEGEAGGITQHIGAYMVKVPGKGTVSFIDTPGHAAFTEMRARGANVTDIVVLVVGADDGVMPQTEEAVRHAQAAEVPIIVALNKIDKPEANPQRVMQELMKFNLVSEELGGETLYVKTSATKGTGIKELLDTILLQAEVLELKADPKRRAEGTVIEAQLDKGRGPVATLLVQQGTLKRGDSIVAGLFAGKVRAMTDDTGKQVSEAGPSMAVQVIGLEGVPEAGDKLNAVEGPDVAREIAEHRVMAKRSDDQNSNQRATLEELMRKMSGEAGHELKLVIKGDVHGSVEAIRAAVEKLSTAEVQVKVILAGVGAITESDVMLAATSQGLVLGFNVRPDSNARPVAERQGIEVRTYRIIYELLDDVRKLMEGKLTPESRENLIGRAEVREVFRITKVGQIAGCKVVEGKAQRSARLRVMRDGVIVHDGRVSGLRRFKDDVREVETGVECGVSVEGFNDVKQGDVLEFYSIEEVARTLGAPSSDGKRPTGGAQASAPA